MDVQFVWDLDDDPDGNVQHIAEHDVSPEEAEEVILAPKSEAQSFSSGLPISFGWTSTGRYLAVVWDEVNDDPRMIRVITAYETDPPKRKRGRR